MSDENVKNACRLATTDTWSSSALPVVIGIPPSNTNTALMMPLFCFTEGK